MQILSYSPKVEAYASVNGGEEFLDLSPDIVMATVGRVSNGASTFSLRLQNVQNKYNGVFMPMDRVKLYCTKVERLPLLTGYVTEVPKYTLYGADITLKGSCSLYRLQQTFWDPGLMESQHLLGLEGDYDENSWDAVLVRLLTEVGGIPAESISVGEMPPDVIAWASRLYELKQEESAQLKSFIDEFYEVLQTHGPKFGSASSSGATTGGADFSGNSVAEIIWNFCISQGFTEQAAAAIIGNAMAESGLNPANDSGIVAYGLFQWEDTSGLQAKASEMGMQISDVEVQLMYMMDSATYQFDTYTGLDRHYYPNGAWCWWPEKMSFSEWQKLADLPLATEIFERVFERASIPAIDRRVGFAWDAYNEFHGTKSAKRR